MQTYRTKEFNSVDEIIRAIRHIRDRKIDELMKEPSLLDFVESNFDTYAISQIKVAFLKRELAELKNSSLDLSYYSSLIKQTKEINSHLVENHPLFIQELKPLFQKYVS
jgi:hypothetical protein